jgi:hypothetical protein
MKAQDLLWAFYLTYISRRAFPQGIAPEVSSVETATFKIRSKTTIDKFCVSIACTVSGTNMNAGGNKEAFVEWNEPGQDPEKH